MAEPTNADVIATIETLRTEVADISARLITIEVAVGAALGELRDIKVRLGDQVPAPV